jgi:hypothetical protein
METFLIQQEIGTDLTFIGQEIASVASTPVQTDSECYSGYHAFMTLLLLETFYKGSAESES